MKKIISIMLSAVMLMSVLTALTLPVSADEEIGNVLLIAPAPVIDEEVSAFLADYEYFADSNGVQIWVHKDTNEVAIFNGEKILFDGAGAPEEEEIAQETVEGEETEETEEVADDGVFDYLSEYITSPVHKLSMMKLYYEKGDNAIFIEETTGEFAFVTKSTGQILLSNPYDVALSTNASKIVKSQLLSQILLTYSSTTTAETQFNSYTDAAMRNQIKVKNIRGGVRVEYRIGRAEVRKLVPERIEKAIFEEEILNKITIENADPGDTEADVARDLRKIKVFYQLKDASDPGLSDTMRRSMLMTFPITQKYAIYVFTSDATEREKYEVEDIIKKYTSYTYEQLEEDHRMVEHTSVEKAPPLFNMALEYYIDDAGFKIRFPANGITFDSSNYSLKNIQVLPYLGAGTVNETGYNVIPDGSGAIVRFEDIGDKVIRITSKVYGQDYSFHEIGGAKNEVIRLPAYGVIRNSEYTVATGTLKEITKSINSSIAARAAEKTLETATGEREIFEANKAIEAEIPLEGETFTESHGYALYIEEGDSLTEITTEHGGGTTHNYHSVYPTFYPKPSDTYALTGISTTGSATWTVESNRKYTGNYTMRIFPLYDEDADYAGMADAIRGYLVDKGVLEPLEDDGNDIPLYLENFGSVQTTQRVVGVPVTVDTPLTTFEQSREMLEELKAEGVSNINLKYRGWANGGLQSTVPNKLSIEKVLGGARGFEKLSEYMKENGFGFYPDMEFTYVSYAGNGFNAKRDTIKTIDKRSATHKVYNGLFQGFEADGSLILSALSAEKFYTNVMKKYSKYDIGGISLASLGSDLSSDNNEDYALNREEAKDMVTNILEKAQEDNTSVLVSGGNAYTWQYVDHILDLPLDSSRNVYTTEAIPLVGMVLHGYKNYSGTAINLDGDYSYSVLKAIENGANPYFIVSYARQGDDNTSELKSFQQFSKYYSIKYYIWKNDIINTYKTLNNALSKVKYTTISEHETIDTRVVRVTYSNGVSFVLNYNNEPYVYEGKTIEALSFIEE